MDDGHKETDRLIDETERRIRETYIKAQSEAQAKLEDYLSRFKIKDAIKAKQVQQGKITAEEYARWRKGQICIGKRWQEMVDTLTQDYVNADKIAMSIVNGYTPEAYAINHNYATFQVEKGSMLDTSYTLYDRHTMERLLKDDPDLLPKAKVDIPKDMRWNRTHINNAIMQGILQGEKIDKIADRLQRVTDMDNAAAVRNARTMITGAENAGRQDGFERAEGMGIEMEKEWLATLDDRTRHSHRQMDGVRVALDAEFPNGCRYPGDPLGEPEEVYNCRCTMVAAVKGVDQSNAPRNDKLGGMSYEEWKIDKAPKTSYDQVDFGGLRDVLGSEFVDSMETLLNFTEHTEVKDLFYKYQDRLKVSDTHNKGGAYYDPQDGGVHINTEAISQGDNIHEPYQTVFHEFAHNIDHVVGGGEWCSAEYMDGLLDATIKSDWDDFVRSKMDYDTVGAVLGFDDDSSIGLRKVLRELDGGSKDTHYYEAVQMLRYGDMEPFDVYHMLRQDIDEYALGNYRSAFDRIAIESLVDEDLPRVASGNISDIIESCCPGVSYPLGAGHGASYWGVDLSVVGVDEFLYNQNRSIEFFAEVCDSMASNPKSYEQMERLFPNAVQVVKDIIGGMLNE